MVNKESTIDKFTVLKMTCMHCAARVEKALNNLDGVSSVNVILEEEAVEVEYNPEKITPNDFHKAATEAGYEFILSDAEQLPNTDATEAEYKSPLGEEEQLHTNNLKESFTVHGMTCMHCVGRVEKAIKGLDGVSDVNIVLEEEAVEVEYNPEKVTPNDFHKAVTDAGYEFVLGNEEEEGKKKRII